MLFCSLNLYNQEPFYYLHFYLIKHPRAITNTYIKPFQVIVSSYINHEK